MVEIRNENSITIPELKWHEKAFLRFEHSYDKQRDILFVYGTPKKPAVSLDLGGHVWVRFLPESGEVVGIEIEDFERVFLIKYPELKVGWEQVKPRIVKRFKPDENGFVDYLRILLAYLKNIMETHPPQLSLIPS